MKQLSTDIMLRWRINNMKHDKPSYLFFNLYHYHFLWINVIILFLIDIKNFTLYLPCNVRCLYLDVDYYCSNEITYEYTTQIINTFTTHITRQYLDLKTKDIFIWHANRRKMI